MKITINRPPRERADLLRAVYDKLKAAGLDLHPDVPLTPTLWAGAAPFGTRREAYDLIEAAGLPQGGNRVNVVIVDQGFDRKLFPGRYGGGFDPDSDQNPPPPRTTPGEGRSAHATAVARAVRDLAPGAMLWDAPLIPLVAPGAQAMISDVEAFTHDAWFLWDAIEEKIWETWAQDASWVLVNAWSIYNRAYDVGIGHYVTNPQHPFNLFVNDLVTVFGVDTVFAAGNCGQFAPDIRCGATDRGPCRSILGANSLKSVLTVGAVRTDMTWLGYSSQGPGQCGLGKDKPDVCAPSGFAADGDASSVLSGTSGAAAVAGGVVAALRSEFGQDTLLPAAMIDMLRNTARKTGEPPGRVGQGVLRGAAATVELAKG